MSFFTKIISNGADSDQNHYYGETHYNLDKDFIANISLMFLITYINCITNAFNIYMKKLVFK